MADKHFEGKLERGRKYILEDVIVIFCGDAFLCRVGDLPAVYIGETVTPTQRTFHEFARRVSSDSFEVYSIMDGLVEKVSARTVHAKPGTVYDMHNVELRADESHEERIRKTNILKMIQEALV